MIKVKGSALQNPIPPSILQKRKQLYIRKHKRQDFQRVEGLEAWVRLHYTYMQQNVDVSTML